MLRFGNSRTVGAVFYLFVISSTCLSVIGTVLAVMVHAPTWAMLLFASVLTIAVPLGGLVGYVLLVPKKNGSRAPSRVQ